MRYSANFIFRMAMSENEVTIFGCNGLHTSEILTSGDAT